MASWIVLIKLTVCFIAVVHRRADLYAVKLISCYVGWYVGWKVFFGLFYAFGGVLGELVYLKNALIDGAFTVGICFLLPSSPMRTWLNRILYFCVTLNIVTYLEYPGKTFFNMYDYLIYAAIAGELSVLLFAKTNYKLSLWGLFIRQQEHEKANYINRIAATLRTAGAGKH